MRSDKFLLSCTGIGLAAAAAMPRSQQSNSEVVQSTVTGIGASVPVVTTTPKARSGSIGDVRKSSFDAKIEDTTRLRVGEPQDHTQLLERRRGGSAGGGGHGGGGHSSGGRGGSHTSTSAGGAAAAGGHSGGSNHGPRRPWSAKKKRDVGLGVGLGLGLPAAAGVAYCVHSRRRRSY